MSTERWLQIGLATLASLGTLVLGMGQDSPALPLLAIFASVASVIFTDALGWVRLNRVLANIAALGAAVFSLSNFMFNDSEHQLLSIAHLLVYLQVILLFQQKTYRIYWELAVLSLLQVVVAAALNLGLSFGVMLAPYTLAAIFSLVLFYLHRENLRFAPPSPSPSSRKSRRPAAATAAAPAELSAWTPLAREQAAMLGVLAERPVAAAARISSQPLDVLLGGRLIRQVLALGIAAASFAAVVFFGTPRQSEAVWRGPAARTRPMVGFSREVSLGRMRDVLQDDAPAMRVKLTYPDTRLPYETVREPYFRGAVLNEYSSRDGEAKWRRGDELNAERLQRRNERPLWGDIVRQEITLEPRGDGTLFTIYPAMRVSGETPRDVFRDRRLQQVFRLINDDTENRGPYHYVLEAAAFDDRWQRAVTVREEPGPPSYQLVMLNTADYTELYPELKALALEILAKEGIDRSNHMRTAYALEGYFRDASKFTYSLDLGQVKQTPDIDPIVDFVLNHRTGHCQYFASATALMLRTLRIPCRLVIGYKGGEYNALGNYYQVREEHAHAWVEVWLPPNEVSDDMIPAFAQSPGGAWLRIDPTPSSQGPGRQNMETGVFSRAGDVLDYARILWADYVLGLNSRRQQESIYQPLSTRLSDAVASALSTAGWKDAIVRFFARLGIDVRGLFPDGWFDWRASLAAIVVCLAGFAMYRAAGAHLPRLTSWLSRRHRQAPSRPTPVIEFYQRLEKSLARQGLVRSRSQTQREFARQASRRLLHMEAPAAAAAAPGLVAEAFYRVRFGGHELSAGERAEIEHSLTALEAVPALSG